MNILFLCTHNSARSILFEACLNHLGAPRLRAFSAGSSPRNNKMPHPLGLAALQKKGIAIDRLSSKSWDAFATRSAPQMDVIVTVCDSAAGEVCPIWPGHPVSVHWGYADPSAILGDAPAMQAAFDNTLAAIHKRLITMLSLPLSELKGDALRDSLQALDHG